MRWFGPVSSIFDIITYTVMFFIICPMICGGNFNDPNVNKILFVSLFNAGWFVESLCSQTLIIHMIRTPKVSFIQSRASVSVLLSSIITIILAIIMPYTNLGLTLEMAPMPGNYFIGLAMILICYMVITTTLKKVYKHRYKEFL